MKKKTVPAILIHLDWIETIKCLSHEQIGAFIIAMLDYANTGKEPIESYYGPIYTLYKMNNKQ